MIKYGRKLEMLDVRIQGDVVIVTFKKFTLTTNKKGFEAIKKYIR